MGQTPTAGRTRHELPNNVLNNRGVIGVGRIFNDCYRGPSGSRYGDNATQGFYGVSERCPGNCTEKGVPITTSGESAFKATGVLNKPPTITVIPFGYPVVSNSSLDRLGQ